MSGPRFSIIIPVYNVEKYIRKCMDTVMGQTFRDYEVIVVDDESPDNSMKIVEEFAEKYPGMITMIHQKNTRQGGARNHGVREAKGEYILFVDSDDYVSVRMLEVVDAELKKYDCDIFAFMYDMVTPEGKYLGEGGFGSLRAGTYIPKKDKKIVMLPAGPVHKAFRRTFYVESGVLFPEKVLYEDAVVRMLFAKASSVVLHDEVLYYYVQSTGSSIRQKPSARMLDILKVTDLVVAQFQDCGLYTEYREPLEASLLYGILYIVDVIMGSDMHSELLSEIAEYITNRFSGVEGNPYLDLRMQKSLQLLCNHEFVKYHNRVWRMTQFREWLLSWHFITQLNKLRWKLIAKREGNSDEI